MKTSRESSTDAKAPQSVNVLLAYDNPRTCAAMLKVLDRVSTRLRDKKLFNVNAFRFGLLKRMDPFIRTAATPDSVELAMVGFSGGSIPDAGLLRWLDNWAKSHAGKVAGLGLLPMGPRTGESVRSFVQALREIAARYRLGFIYEPETGFTLLEERGPAVA
jgi:hypothetical protein